MVVLPVINADFTPYEIGMVGDQREFNCETSGFPQPEVTWSLNNQPVRPDATEGIFLRNNGQTLYVNQLTPDWDGNVTCSAINNAGRAHFSGELEIFKIPEIISGILRGIIYH